MAEEFAEFIKKLNQEPVDEQLSKLKDVVSKLVVIVENFVKYYDMEFSIIYNKIIKLETKRMSSNLSKIDKLVIRSPPPSPQERPVGNENLRGSVLGELKDLFEKKE